MAYCPLSRVAIGASGSYFSVQLPMKDVAKQRRLALVLGSLSAFFAAAGVALACFAADALQLVVCIGIALSGGLTAVAQLTTAHRLKAGSSS